ncbi:hypothetical protein EBU95_17330 [bacterium]|nr:hypothetical protein [bacterium]
MILNYYGHKIYLKEGIEIECTREGSSFSQSLNRLYDSLPIANDPNQNGSAKTTVNLDNSFILGLDDVNPFLQDICKHISEALLELEKFMGEFFITRVWTNRMFENACGSSHVHDSNCDYVGIYYYEAPENCSMFIINGFEENNIYDFDLSKNNKIGIQVKPGTLIIHPRMLNHSVSKNLTNIPRTVFVFEILKK